ncbi:MAG TPA: class I SAM-dependent methyltransferase [Chloroflexota bacterium]|nr:class I SAM-dependent methyltransferase [Chloroflexota bacterium]
MDSPAAQRWDERYSTTEYVFGTAANDFLAAVVEQLPKGRALCLGEGEGRNAVFLANRGYAVTAVDVSSAGLQKAERLAAERGTPIETTVADLAEYAIEPQSWDVVVLIFVHLPPELRQRVHRAAVEGLKAGGALVLEAFTPERRELRSGGPPDDELLMRLEVLREELQGLELEVAQEVRREIHEGTRHNGIKAVVQVLGFRTAERPRV